jgi:hypothetical protein
LSWSFIDPDPGDTSTLTFDVYFGTSSTPPLVISNQMVTDYLPGTLSSFTQYYWKIVARDHNHPRCYGETVLPITLSFTTASLPPQFNDNAFSPANDASGVNPLVTLSWSASDPEGDPLTYDVYLGTDQLLQQPEDRKTVNQTTTTYKPGKTLYENTQYYWKIVARDNHGSQTESSILTFNTGESLVKCNLVPNSTAIHRGEILSFQANVVNNTDKTGTVLFATRVTKPDLSLYPSSGYLGPYNVPLSPHGSYSLPVSHTIPTTAPLGHYTYHGYVGKVGVGLIYECQFDFDVTL